MVTWNPTQYLLFTNERLRPALDLLGQIPVESPSSVFDLGCGPGNVTVLLKDRWPKAHITGLDSSPEMLEKAKALGKDISWEIADLNQWRAKPPADVLHSNAALQWLDDHATLYPHLVGSLRMGGVLAIQVPNQFAGATHTAISDVIRGGKWRQRLEPRFRAHPTLDSMEYYRILRPLVSSLDIWETTYYHVLQGKDPVVEWFKGLSLRPVLDELTDPAESKAFLEQYADRMRAAYPPQADGKTILPFKRLFIVAKR